MNFKNLLTKLSELEAAIQQFSYEELSVLEARELKGTLEAFRAQIQAIIQSATDEIANKKRTTVHRLRRKKIEDEKELPHCGLGSEREIPKFSKFAPGRSGIYPKDSALSNKQLEYLNTILEAADIATRVWYEPKLSDWQTNAQYSGKTKADKQFKPNVMSNSNKRSDIKKSSGPISGNRAKVNLKPLLEDCLGKKDLLGELIKLYKQNALEFIGQLRIHLQKPDFEAIRFASHKIKSGLRMMNTQELLVIAEQIELGSKTDQDIKHLKFLFNCFVKEYPGIERAIDEEFEKLN